jgi:hypothetical protein
MPSVTSLHPSIRAAFRAHLLTIAGLPTRADGQAKNNIDWEGARFTPQPGLAYIEERLLRAGAQRRSVGPGARIEHVGIYQLSVMWPLANTGSPGPQTSASSARSDTWLKSAEELAAILEDAFPDTLRLTRSGFTIAVGGRGGSLATTSSGSGRIDGDRYRIPVSIPWSCDTYNVN